MLGKEDVYKATSTKEKSFSNASWQKKKHVSFIVFEMKPRGNNKNRRNNFFNRRKKKDIVFLNCYKEKLKIMYCYKKVADQQKRKLCYKLLQTPSSSKELLIICAQYLVSFASTPGAYLPLLPVTYPCSIDSFPWYAPP